MSKSCYYALIIGESRRGALGSDCPQPIPFGRFVEYLQVFSKIIGHDKSVNFKDVKAGSTQIIVEVSRENAQRAIDTRISKPSLPTQRNVKRLKRMLHEDRYRADIGYSEEFSSGSMEFQTVLRLEDVRLYDFGSYRQRGVLDGFVVQVGHSDTPTVPVHIQSQSGERHLCRAPSAMGFDMGRHRGVCLRVVGEGVWRNTLGYWRAEEFKIESYRPLKATRTLTEALASMRNTGLIEVLTVRKDPAKYLPKPRNGE